MVKTDPLGALAAAVTALVAVGLLVLMLVVVQPRPAGATFPGPNGKIAYADDDGEFPGGIDAEIYTIDPTGGMPFQVTDNDTEEGSPDYSPDGTKIAYSAFDGNDYEIYTINATGGHPSKSPTTIRTTKPLPTRPMVRRSPIRAMKEETTSRSVRSTPLEVRPSRSPKTLLRMSSNPTTRPTARR